MSNMKQLGLGMIMYCQDYDETFVMHPVYEDPLAPGWAERIEPYLKSVGVLRCPSDSGAGQSDNNGYAPTLWGPYISYAANGLAGGLPDMVAAGKENYPRGIVSAWMPWSEPSKVGVAVADMSRPADTIMLAEKASDYCEDKGTLNWIGNRVRFQPTSILMWSPTDTNSDTYYSWIGADIPNGKRTAGTAPWKTINGGVVPKHNELANFAFADGHVKAMKPHTTNPDPTGRPQDNMWDAARK